MWEILWSTVYLLSNVYTGLGKMRECENHTDDVQTRQTDELHKMITQINCTNESHKSIAQDG